MIKGCVIFAFNNEKINYVDLALFAAKQVVTHLNVPVSIITQNAKWVRDTYDVSHIDQIIETNKAHASPRKLHDGSLSSDNVIWNNGTRNLAYELSPYDKTLVIDSDYIVSSDLLKQAFDIPADLQIYRKSIDLAAWRPTAEFERLNEYSIPFYWATVFMFEKNPVMQAFFTLVEYIRDNWNYFRNLYVIEAPAFRNDYAFSIAIHIMNGKSQGGFARELPGKLFYAIDKDYLVDIKDQTMRLLIEKKDYVGEYQIFKLSGTDLHMMNKQSLLRYINGGQGV